MIDQKSESKRRQIEFDFDFCESEPAELLGLLTPDDIYSRAEDLLTVIREDRRIERKPPGIHPEPLGDWFAMWANTSPDGGLIAFGMNDKDGSAIGCENVDQKHINNIENAGYDFAHGVNYVQRRVRMRRADGIDDWIILFRVYYHPARVIETVKRKVFVRRGDRKVELKTDEERRQLRIDKGEIQFEQEPCGLKYPDDFEAPLISQLVANVRKIRGIRESSLDVRILSALRLGERPDGSTFIPNIACAILFATDPVKVIPGCRVHFLRFRGTDEKHGSEFNETANIPPFEGPLAKQIDEVTKLLDTLIDRFTVFDAHGKFETKPEYPRDAYYEAVVNACVHRSYNFKNMKIFVKMFDDRLQIESPGPFPPGVTPQTIYDQQHSRNPFIMEAMRYLGYVREIGEGAPRIREEMLRLNLPAPEFSQPELIGGSWVRVILRNDRPKRHLFVGDNVARIVGESVTSQLSENEKIVLNYVAVAGKITVTEAVRQTGQTWHTCKKMLDRLVKMGILEWKKRPGMKVDRQAHYVLATPKPAKSPAATGKKRGRPSKRAAKRFSRGELNLSTADVLWEAGKPLTISEIARRLIDGGYPSDEGDLKKTLQTMLALATHSFEGQPGEGPWNLTESARKTLSEGAKIDFTFDSLW